MTIIPTYTISRLDLKPKLTTGRLYRWKSIWKPIALLLFLKNKLNNPVIKCLHQPSTCLFPQPLISPSNLEKQNLFNRHYPTHFTTCPSIKETKSLWDRRTKSWPSYANKYKTKRKRNKNSAPSSLRSSPTTHTSSPSTMISPPRGN